MFGAHNMIRTRDLLITNQLLYQLSYVGINLVHSPRIELGYPAYETSKMAITFLSANLGGSVDLIYITD